MLSAEFDLGLCNPKRGLSITTQYSERGLHVMHIGHCRRVLGGDRAFDGCPNQLLCPPDVTEQPIYVRQIARSGARISAKAKPGVTIPLGIIDSQRLPQVFASLHKVALK